MTDQEFPKLDWQTLRQIARQVGISWVDAMLRDFKEPERTGAHKGDPIGLFLAKRKASLLMVLHPYGLKLNEIATLVGTTHGTIRFWRCRGDFQEAESEGYVAFGEHLCNTFERIIEGHNLRPNLVIEGIPALEKRPLDLLHLLPFFSPEVIVLIEELVRVKFLCGKRAYSVLATGFLSLVYKNIGAVADTQQLKTFRAWMKDENVLSFAQIMLTDLIDNLADPDYREKSSAEEIGLCAETLKGVVFSFLSLL